MLRHPRGRIPRDVDAPASRRQARVVSRFAAMRNEGNFAPTDEKAGDPWMPGRDVGFCLTNAKRMAPSRMAAHGVTSARPWGTWRSVHSRHSICPPARARPRLPPLPALYLVTSRPPRHSRPRASEPQGLQFLPSASTRFLIRFLLAPCPLAAALTNIGSPDRGLRAGCDHCQSGRWP